MQAMLPRKTLPLGLSRRSPPMESGADVTTESRCTIQTLGWVVNHLPGLRERFVR
jgi:hypothetical protein